jgi:hypothetical protein
VRDLDDSIAWTEGGNNALTGTHDGKQAVGEVWGQLTSKGVRTVPHDFVTEGDKVVVLTTREQLVARGVANSDHERLGRPELRGAGRSVIDFVTSPHAAARSSSVASPGTRRDVS